MRLFLALLFMFVAACTQPRLPSSHTSEAAGLAAKTVALVKHRDTGEVRSYCSGVWVSPTMILTAAHCAEDEESLEYVTQLDVYAPGDLLERTKITTHPCQLFALDRQHDLALLVDLFAAPHDIARTSLEQIRVGSLAQTVGHPLGLWWSYSSGDVSAVRLTELGINILWIQATTPISPGNSGGGLFDAHGHLIGIVSRGLPMSRRAQGLNFFVHAQYIDALLRSHGIRSPSVQAQ